MGARAQLQRQRAGDVDLFAMTLAVVEGDAVHLIILLQRLNQAGGGVLSTAKDYNGSFHHIVLVENFAPMVITLPPAEQREARLHAVSGGGTQARLKSNQPRVFSWMPSTPGGAKI